jgi:hypothetical protein
MFRFFALIILITTVSCKPTIQSGAINYIENFKSNHVASRNIEVYTPPQYSAEKNTR